MTVTLAGCAASGVDAARASPAAATSQGTLPAPTVTPAPGRAPTTSAARPAPVPERQRLIASARWVIRGGRASLAVEPSRAQRAHPDLRWAEAGWRQLVAAVPTARRPGMREQYICHALFAPRKPRFYLEPWRPARSLVSTIAEGCNPGPRKDLG